MKHTVVVIANLLVLLLDWAECRCKFPTFMKPTEDKHLWTSGFGSKTILEYYGESEIEGKEGNCANGPCYTYIRECITHTEGNKYLVLQKTQGTNSFQQLYICLEFIRRSQSIVQLKRSKQSDDPDPMLCHDNDLKYDPWPIVSVDGISREKSRCPIKGGFNVKMFNPDGNLICADSVLPIRIESECDEHDSIVFNFRDQSCIPSGINMEVIQQVDCVAHWSEAGHVFVALRDPNQVDRVWCLRYRKHSGDEVDHIYLFKDFVCHTGDPGEITQLYVSINLDRFVVTTTCSDEFSACTKDSIFCETKYKENCPKTCNGCNIREEDTPCIFPERFHSKWLGGGKKKGNMKIGTYSMEFNTVHYQCLRGYGRERKNRRLLLRSFENGCYPRYVCMELEKPDRSVLIYRFGRKITWPVTINEDTICDDNYFIKETRHSHRGQEIPFTSLIRKHPVHAITCNIPKGFESNVYLRDSATCRECIRHDALLTNEYFELKSLSCISPTSIRYKCLANFDFVDPEKYGDSKYTTKLRAILTITEPYDRERQHLCWIFRQSVSSKQIAVVDSSICNAGTAKQVFQRHHRDIALERFTVMDEPTDECFTGRDNLYVHTTETPPIIYIEPLPTNNNNSGSDNPFHPFPKTTGTDSSSPRETVWAAGSKSDENVDAGSFITSSISLVLFSIFFASFS